MHEYEPIEDIDVPSQGDVLEWMGQFREVPWKTFGVIVTADCDLARDKHRGVISYIPAWLTEDFVWSYWRPDKLTAKLDDLIKKSVSRVAKWREKQGSGNGTLSAEAFRSWLARVGPE